MKKHLYVLPGGGSPYNEHYKKVYDTIISGGEKYNYNVTILDYCGFGQFPDYGKGLSLPTSIKKVRKQLKNAPLNSTLLARCYGCNVIVSILANEPEALSKFSKIVLWGLALNSVWDDFCKIGVIKWNEKYRSKGVQLADDYFETLNDVERDAKKIAHKNIVLGFGTKDIYTSHSFNNRIARIINTSGGNASVVFINGAEHSIIKGNTDKKIVDQYYSLIF